MVDDTAEAERLNMQFRSRVEERAPIPDREPAPSIQDVAKNNVRLRGVRRALATNSVQAAREHAGHGNEPWTTEESDILVAVMDLLDRVAGG